MSELFGWDLVYKVSQNEIEKKEDVLTLFIHYVLIKGGYKCIGLGEERVLTGNEELSESLPTDWSKENTYSIRYIRNNQVFVLKGIPVDDAFVFNLISPTSMLVSTAAFNVESTIAATTGPLSALIPCHDEVLKRVQSELLSPMGQDTTKEATTQASASHPQPQPIRVPAPEPLCVPRPFAGVNPSWLDPERDPLRVGRSDLDPLGRGIGGGMIFNPFDNRPVFDPNAGLSGPPLPRGAVPPGARFDPFGPSTGVPPRPRRPPSSDEFPPPDFGDMFM